MTCVQLSPFAALLELEELDTELLLELEELDTTLLLELEELDTTLLLELLEELVLRVSSNQLMLKR